MMFQDVIVPSGQAQPPVQNDNPPTPQNPPAPPEETDKSKKKREGLKGLLSVVGIFAMAALLAIGITSFIFQSYQVDGPSMETTLQNEDRLIVLKTPKTWASIRGKKYIPERYEVVVFDSVTTFDNGIGKQLIKRVIGLPGDRVVVDEGHVMVYNDQFPDGMDPDQDQEYADSFTTTSGNVELTVNENEIFVLGDNRSNSLDSRNFGTVPVENVVGKLSVRIYPLDKITVF